MRQKRGYYDVFVKTCATHPSRVAVRYYDNGTYKNYTYSELYGVCEYISQNLQQLKCQKGVIGLIAQRNIVIPCIIAAAHKCSTTFMFVDPSQDVESIAKQVAFTIVITITSQGSENNLQLFGKKPNITVAVFDMAINFYTCEFPPDPNSKLIEHHSFIAMTSGSTGEPKHIQVPIQCLQPNINDLTKMFNITPDDVIFFSTPLTFDPSMVEILLACMNGASLLIAPEQPNVLFPKNSQNSVTFWQTTPSKFLQFSNSDIQGIILSPTSTLKILALGGEPLSSVKRLRELKDNNNNTRIFTLYGVTEMSCWACVTELDLNKLTNSREIPLGNCLSETQLIVECHKKNHKHTGNIILVSKTRNCVVLNKGKGKEEESFLKFVDTGDIGEVSGGTIYYRGRRDDTVKRFGHKVNLQLIEVTIMQCPQVKTCACLWLPKPLLLVVYFSSETINTQELGDFLKCKLDERHWPDKIIRVDNLPTNNHGKISKQVLCKMYERTTDIQSTDSLKVFFLKELNVLLRKYFTYDQVKSKDFFSIGGTSFLALTLSNKLSVTLPQMGKLVLPYLLSRNTIDEIIQIVQKELLGEGSKPKKQMKRSKSLHETDNALGCIDSTLTKKAHIGHSINSIQFMTLWSLDTGKCIDATPTLFKIGYHVYVTVGSHSGKVVVVDATNGELQGIVKLKSRIEAAVIHCPGEHPSGVVGSYNGTIVKFSIDPVTELWRINIGSMIKSKGIYCQSRLYIASYDGNVRCIDITNGDVLATIDICEQGISADLVIAKNQYLLLGTLSGVCASIHTDTNLVIWRCTLDSPVFSNPVLYDEDKFVIFAEVNGEIHCRTVEKGIKIWKYQGAKGNVFSSFYIRKLCNVNWQIVFGCHDKIVYSLHIKNFQPKLHWKAQLSAPIYSTPCAFGDKYILAAESSGKLTVMDSETGSIVGDYQLPNEIFSSPIIHGDTIFIGCRNDHLYSIQCNFKSDSLTFVGK